MDRLLVDANTPATEEELVKLAEQAFRFLMTVAKHPKVAAALRARGYTDRAHVEGQHALRDALAGVHAADAVVEEDAKMRLHAWLRAQHERALGGEMKRAHLIALGVVRRWKRPVPEQSGIVLKGVRR